MEIMCRDVLVPNAVEAESRTLNNCQDQSSSKSRNYITLTTKPAVSGSVRRTSNGRKRNTPRLVSTCGHWGIEINRSMTLHEIHRTHSNHQRSEITHEGRWSCTWKSQRCRPRKGYQGWPTQPERQLLVSSSYSDQWRNNQRNHMKVRLVWKANLTFIQFEVLYNYTIDGGQAWGSIFEFLFRFT